MFSTHFLYMKETMPLLLSGLLALLGVGVGGRQEQVMFISESCSGDANTDGIITETGSRGTEQRADKEQVKGQPGWGWGRLGPRKNWSESQDPGRSQQNTGWGSN